MSVLVTLLVIVLALAWGTSTYTRVVGLRKQVFAGWRRVDALLKRRHDLIPAFSHAVKDSPALERKMLDALAEAQARAMGATGPAEAGPKEDDLTEALERIFVAAEHQPHLLADEHIRQLLEELNRFPTTIGVARESYNTVAAKYNSAIRGFPGKMVAGFANFKAAQLFAASGARPQASGPGRQATGVKRSGF